MTGGPSTTDSSNKQCSNQLSLDAKTSRHTKSNDKAVQIGNSKKLAVICQGSAQRVNQGFAYNLKLTINIDKTEKSKIIFHLESGDVPGISSGLFQEGSSLLDCFQWLLSSQQLQDKNLADPTFSLQTLTLAPQKTIAWA